MDIREDSEDQLGQPDSVVTTHTVAHSGRGVCWRQSGKGPAVVLLHGGHGGTRRPRGDLRLWPAALNSGDSQALEEVMRHNLGAHILHNPARIDATALRLHTDACLQTRFHSRTISRAANLRPLLAQYAGQPG